MNTVNFKANVRIKDVVGRDLINNDNVAIIELIKNAKDAGSSKVEITFSGANKESTHSKIIIQDYGHGMTLQDIKEKWLNIAYSEKRENTSKKKIYAGSKGIGRFSCDRLGRNLDLYTKTADGKLIWLAIDWTKFEVDEKSKEIGHITFKAQEIPFDTFIKKTGLKKFSPSGTILVISDLRAVWGRDKLLGLKKELEKFSIDPKKEFDIFLDCRDYPQSKAELSGKIKSKIFEKLEFRTTSIHSSVNEDGSQIKTILTHDGSDLFTLIEKNPYEHLKNIKVSVYFLNQQAKAFFKRESGSTSVEFGSIFLFLNGFRVLPYGEESDDWLGLDRRKQQGTRRYFGTREIIGRVEINDNASVFKPVSSREGLVNNEAYRELTDNTKSVPSRFGEGKPIFGYLQNVIRKLERFVVEGLDWDRLIKEDEQHIADGELLKLGRDAFVNRDKDIVSGLWSIILTRTNEVDIIDVEVNDAYLKKMAERAGREYKTLAQNMQKKLHGVSISTLTPGEKKNLSTFISRIVKQVEAKEASNTALEKKARELKEEKAEVERKLTVETKRRLFAEAESTVDTDHVMKMQHMVGLIASDAFKRLDDLYQRNIADPDSVTKASLVAAVEKTLFLLGKIKQVSKFATKANFDLGTNNVKSDLIQFIEEYIETVCSAGLDWGVKVTFEKTASAELVRSFKPIEVTMVVDNIISNAAKARARSLRVSASSYKGKIKVKFSDDGKGLQEGKYKPEEHFEKGITTTTGSGLGLHHVKQIIEAMKGTAKISNNADRGATLLLEFET